MKEFTYDVNNPLGLHARPASMLVKQASDFQSRITISKEGKEVSAKEILGIMGLCVKKDHEITIRADGIDEEQAIEALSSIVKKHL